MTTTTQELDRNTAVKRVNDTLRGPVSDILSRLIPELSGLSKTEVYERVLDKPELLTKCFDLFRDQRHWFRHVVVDGRSRPVLDDTVVLACGRTLEEVIAMVVRTSAKRYFRHHVPGGKSHSSSTDTAAADELYEAIKDYLMHEWQVPLVPAYADMSLALVRSLGPRLLIIREMAELRRLIDGPAAETPKDENIHTPSTQTQPQTDEAEDPLSLYLTLDGKRLRPDAFALGMDKPEIRAALPGGPYVDPMSSLSDILWEVGGPTARIMISGLKLSPEQLGVMLVTAHSAMGKQVFNRLFGFPGQPELILRLVQQGLSDGIGENTSYADCAGFIHSFVNRAYTHHRAKDGDKT